MGLDRKIREEEVRRKWAEKEQNRRSERRERGMNLCDYIISMPLTHAVA
jgi:hypothetical protein